ncbi:MAG: preprotein translocase subunit YajC, partial [Phycisphaerales bacterium]
MIQNEMMNTLPLIVAQGPAAAGEAAAPSAGTAVAPAASGAPAGGAPAPAQGLDFFTIMLFAVLLAFIVMTVLGGRRERKKFEQMLSSIKKNDQVRTVGGIIGSVVEVK